VTAAAEPRPASSDRDNLEKQILARAYAIIENWEGIYSECTFRLAWYSEIMVEIGVWSAKWESVRRKEKKTESASESEPQVSHLLEQIRNLGSELGIGLTMVAVPGYPGDAICAWWTDPNGTRNYARIALQDISSQED